MSERLQKTSDAADIDDLYASANNAYQAGDAKLSTQIAEQILAKNPQFAPNWQLLAKLANQENLLDKAIEFIKQAIMIDPDNPEYYLDLGKLFKQQNKISAAKSHYLKAIKLNPSYTDAYFEIGILDMEQNNFEQSFTHFTKYQQLDPNNFAVYNNLACILAMYGRSDLAIENFQKSINLNPDHPDAYSNLGNIYLEQKNYAAAKQNYEKAIQINPNIADPHNNLGMLHKLSGNYQAAQSCFDQAILINPNHGEAYNNQAAILIERQDYLAATKLITKVLSILPNYPDAFFNLGICQLNLENFTSAEQAFTKYIQLNPGNYLAHFHLGRAYDMLGNSQLAAKHYHEAIHLNAEYIPAIICLSTIYRLTNQLTTASELFKRIIQIDPDNTFANAGLAFIYQKFCDWESLAEIHSNVVRVLSAVIQSNEYTYVAPFEASALPIPSSLVTQIYYQNAQRLQTNEKFSHKIKNNQKLKIGYLSPDFNHHPVGLQLRDMLSHHDRDKFIVYCYSLVKNTDNPYTQLIEASCDYFIDIHDHGKYSAAKRIYADGIDILVDLAGYTGNAMPGLLAYQPAPVQCHWLGSMESLQADFIQYFITSEYLVSEQDSENYSEKMLYLPQTAYATPKFNPEINASRTDYNLPEDKFVFCCFTQSYRISKECFSLWLDILQQTDNSVLWLRADSEIVEKNLLNFAKQQDIDASRIIFCKDGMLNQNWHHSLADLWLDPLEFTSGSATFLSLAIDLPLLTISGDRPTSRVAASLLNCCDLHSLIANSKDEYRNIAIDLYNNQSKLQEIKNQIALNKSSFFIFDAKGFIRQLESGYSQAIDNFRQGKNEHIKV